jgi:hypothetical protein
MDVPADCHGLSRGGVTNVDGAVAIDSRAWTEDDLRQVAARNVRAIPAVNCKIPLSAERRTASRVNQGHFAGVFGVFLNSVPV